MAAAAKALATDLSVRETLTGVYDAIVERALGREIIVPAPSIKKQVGDDSDMHRTRVGYSECVKLHAIVAGNNGWLFGRNVRAGAYPADFLDTELFALKLRSRDETEESNDMLAEEARRRVGSYLRDAVLVGFSTGVIGMRKVPGTWGTNPYLLYALSVLPAHISQDLEVKRDAVSASLGPVVLAPARYHKSAIPHLEAAVWNIFLTA